MADPFDLSGRVALVTGASQGLGRRFARVLTERGAAVALAARQIDRLEALRHELSEQGRHSAAIGLDVSDAASVEQAILTAEDVLGPIDILVNNAGVAVTRPFLELSEADWDRVLDTNLKGAFRVAQAVARRMATHGGGTIVNVASVLSFGVIGQLGPYAVSKEACGSSPGRWRSSWRVTRSASTPLPRATSRPR